MIRATIRVHVRRSFANYQRFGCIAEPKKLGYVTRTPNWNPSRLDRWDMARTSPAERPLSPHLQIYKPTITMMMSILHRVTGAALFFGTLLVVIYLLALAGGKSSFAAVQSIYGSWLGKLVLFGYAWALFHHMLGGIRHFIWDTGAGLERETRFRLAWATLIGSLVLAALFILFSLKF